MTKSSPLYIVRGERESCQIVDKTNPALVGRHEMCPPHGAFSIPATVIADLSQYRSCRSRGEGETRGKQRGGAFDKVTEIQAFMNRGCRRFLPRRMVVLAQLMSGCQVLTIESILLGDSWRIA